MKAMPSIEHSSREKPVTMYGTQHKGGSVADATRDLQETRSLSLIIVLKCTGEKPPGPSSPSKKA